MNGNRIRGAFFGAAGIMAGITGIIRFIAGDGSGMAKAMLRFAPPESTGLPESAYSGVAGMITRYLTGAEERFAYTLTGADGGEISCFHDYEAAHMADCRGLISLDTAVCLICLALMLGMILWQILRARGRGAEWLPFLRGVRGALFGLLILATALILWAVTDFDSLFILFHRAAFTNELWLLNPRTDLLIRLMPTELFVHLGIRGVIPAAGWMGVLALGTELGIFGIRKKMNGPDGKREKN